MTRAEFIDLERRSRRQQNWLGLWLAGVFLLMAGVGVPLVAALDLDRPSAAKIATLVAFGIVFCVLAIIPARLSAKALIRCPDCGKALTGPYFSQVVIACGHCGHCGAAILSDASVLPVRARSPQPC